MTADVKSTNDELGVCDAICCRLSEAVALQLLSLAKLVCSRKFFSVFICSSEILDNEMEVNVRTFICHINFRCFNIQFSICDFKS